MKNCLQYCIHYFETAKHKLWVLWYILRACAALLVRALKHDLSKYSKIESKHFAATIGKLKDLDYGSQEYKDALKSMQPAIDHHYRCNSHHPEYFSIGFKGLDYIDIIEMLCDWKAASKRHATGDFAKSLKINRERFGYSDFDYVKLFYTAQEIGLIK